MASKYRHESQLRKMILNGKYDKALRVRLEELYRDFGLVRKGIAHERIGHKDKPARDAR